MAKTLSDPTKILVIFDLDFTLIDNCVAIRNAFNYAAEALDIKPLDQKQIRANIGIPLKEMFLPYLDSEGAEKAVNYFREYYREHFFEGVKFIPGATALLRKLKKIGYNLALLTSKKTELAEKLLDYLMIKTCFSVIVGEQREFEPKPNPASVHYIISKFPEVEKAFLIGDHPIDCLTAQNAGINFIGVLTGSHSKEDFHICTAKNIIFLKSVREINPVLHLI